MKIEDFEKAKKIVGNIKSCERILKNTDMAHWMEVRTPEYEEYIPWSNLEFMEIVRSRMIELEEQFAAIGGAGDETD